MSRIIVFVALMLVVSMTLAQSSDALQGDVPPQVIDVSPFPGTEVQPEESLTITFNQAMQADVTQSAVRFVPMIAGDFAWLDSKTLAFNPAEGWQRGENYTLTIDTTATAENGLTLPDAYVADIRIAGFLEVSTTIPEDGTQGIQADATITVAFNRPVVPLVTTGEIADLPDPLSIEPAVSGSGEWLNTSIYQFIPDELAGGTQYTVTVNAGLTAVNGAILQDDYSFTFQTLQPEILSTNPSQGSQVGLDDAFTVNFSQAMDKASVEEAFSISEGGNSVSGAFSWSENSRNLTFTPDERLSINTTFNFVIDANIAKGANGAALRQGRNFTFETVPLPFIAYTNPANGDQYVSPGYRRVYIEFGTPMNTETFEGRYEISPEPKEITPVVYGNRDLGLEFEFEFNTTYTVIIKAGTEDVYGNAIASDYTFSFTTTEIESSFYFNNDRYLVTTGSYRQDTALATSISGTPTVNFNLWRLPMEKYPAVFRYLYDEDIAELERQSELMRSWSESIDTGSAYDNYKLLLKEGGGVLDTGVYLVKGTQVVGSLLDRVFNPSGSYRDNYVSIAVTDTTLTVKQTPYESLVWVTDLASGRPVAEVNVLAYNLYSNEQVGTQMTDSDGVATFPRLSDVYYIVETETRFGLWSTSSSPSAPQDDTYVYTERPIYRPGETVYFKGFYRQRDDFSYTVDPSFQQVEVYINDQRGQELYNETLTVTEFGSFSGELLLPESAAVGYMNIAVRKDGYNIASVNAQIAEFRVPEFMVNVTPAQDEIISGEDISAVIKGEYFSGGAVSNASISWSANASETSFNYTGPGRYLFGDLATSPYYYDMYFDYGYYGYGGFGGRYIADGSGTTDGNGELVVNINEVRTQGYNPENVTVEGTISDESGQFISGRSTVLVHPAEVYVGLRRDQYFIASGEQLTVQGITVTPQSEVVTEQRVTLKLVEHRWIREEIEGQFGRYNWTVEDIEVEAVDVTSDANGEFSHVFTPENPGNYSIIASTFDRLERTHQSSFNLWVTGTANVWWGEPTPTIDLIADQDIYQAGDTAKILMPLSLSGTSYLLIAIERDGVMSYETVEVNGTSYLYELPITAEHEPGIFVYVMVMHGIDDENLVPVYRSGNLRLEVEPNSKALTVDIVPSKQNAQPGDEVSFDITATDADGNPVQGEFSLALVDKAILSLASPNSQDPLAHYYSRFSQYVYTVTQIDSLIDAEIDRIFGEEKTAQDADSMDEATDDYAGAGYAMEEAEMMMADGAADMALAAPTSTQSMRMADVAGGGEDRNFNDVTVRENFQQTPLWQAHVVTDENGKATVSVTMPDNLTIWNMTARGVTSDTLVGSAEVDVRSTLPFLVRPATPRFFVVGDEVTLAMVINNNTSENQDVRVTMQGTGFELIDGQEAEQSGIVEANARKRFTWRVVIQDVEGVDLTFIALGADGFEDASKPALTNDDGLIPVYRYTAPDTVGTGGAIFDGSSRTEGIVIPNIADTDQGTLEISLDPSLAVTTLDALDYLENYPHQCIEQTVSRFLPNLVNYRALQLLGVDDPVLEANLVEQVQFGLDKLHSSQNPDGGWGWFVSMESNYLVTAYALQGLLEAQKSGFDVRQDAVDRGINFLRNDFIQPTEDTEPYRLNRQAYYFYVLSINDDGRYDPSLGELDALFNVRLEMNIDAHAYLLMAYNAVAQRGRANTDAINSLSSDLISKAKLSSTGAHWEEEFKDWWNWGTDIRSTALSLSALIQTDPNNELLPNVVRWLMVARDGKHWTTTQETVWSIIGLTDWMVATNELNGNYDYTVILNGAEIGSDTVTPVTVRDGRELSVAVGDLLLDELNKLTIARGEGEGALYYTTHLKLRLYASEVDAIDRGVGITREYLDENGDPVTEVNMGDIVNVRITVSVPETIYYFVLEDPLPAGLEAMDTSLLTTTQNVQGAQLQPTRNPSWWWWWWVWDHTEIRDESVNLYADSLWQGTYVYTYQAQATTPGKFQTMPSHGYAFYFPEVFGRTDGVLFTVNDTAE